MLWKLSKGFSSGVFHVFFRFKYVSPSHVRAENTQKLLRSYFDTNVERKKNTRNLNVMKTACEDILINPINETLYFIQHGGSYKIKWPTQQPVFSTGPDWTWLDLTGSDRTWVNLTGPDQTWPDLTGSDWTWPDMTGPDWIWLDLAAPDWIWLDLTWLEWSRTPAVALE